MLFTWISLVPPKLLCYKEPFVSVHIMPYRFVNVKLGAREPRVAESTLNVGITVVTAFLCRQKKVNRILYWFVLV